MLHVLLLQAIIKTFPNLKLEAYFFMVKLIVMKSSSLKILCIGFFILLCSTVSWGNDGLTRDDLVQRNNLYYKKFSSEPFSGDISGLDNGKFKDGRRDGPWEYFHENGQLRMKVTYKNDKPEGFYEVYFDNGKPEWKGTYKNGKMHGVWEWSYENGHMRVEDNYKNGKRHGPLTGYHKNGFLRVTGEYKDGKKDGQWMLYDEDGQRYVTADYIDGAMQ